MWMNYIEKEVWVGKEGGKYTVKLKEIYSVEC